jgi:uncharacterized protein YjiK
MIHQFNQMKCPPLLLVFGVYALTLLQACKERSHSSPAGYDLNKPQTAELGKVLNEISGISWDNENQALAAISDSKEKVFLIGLRNKKLQDLTEKVIPKDADTEDILVTDSCYYVLSSWGELRKIALRAKDTAQVQSYRMNLAGKNDFETMYYDPASKSIVLICKKCEAEKGQGIRMAYRFDPANRQFDSTSFYTISTKDVEELVKSSDAKFEPSAAAIHPYNKRLYILSSAGNLLVVADNSGKVMEAYNLNPDLFPQAEGIAFAPNGDMYIANEGKYGVPTLLHFPYALKHQKEQKKK